MSEQQSKLCIELFGGLRLHWEGGEPVEIPANQPGELLALLALDLRRNFTREEILETLWPEEEPERARRKLRDSLHGLRRLLDQHAIAQPGLILATRTNVRLNPALVRTDVGDFEAAMQAAISVADLIERAMLVAQAIETYRGALLTGFYQDCFIREQDRLAGLYESALHILTQIYEQLGDLDRAAETARRAVVHNPLMEEAHCSLMRVYAEMGQPSAVLRQFQELERILKEELGEEPSAATRLLMESLRTMAQARAASHTRGNGNEKPAVTPHTADNKTGLLAEAPTRSHPSTAIHPSARPTPLRRRRSLALAGAVLLLLLLAGGIVWKRYLSSPSQSPPSNVVSTAIPAPRVLWVFRNSVESDDTDGGDPQAMTTDAAGNIYITGFVHTLHHDVDFLTLKISPEGHRLWQARYNGSGNDVDRARAIAVDAKGYVYVVGDSDNGKGNDLTHLGGLDYAIVKYDPDGKRSSTWPDEGDGVGARRYNGRDNGEERPVAIAVDDQGNVFVTGCSYAKAKHSAKPEAVMEWATISYGSDGKRRWVSHEKADGDTPTEACALALDPKGNVYVTGAIATGNSNVLTAKYDGSTGEKLWEQTFGGPSNGHDIGRAIALDAAGNVYVGGTTYTGDPMDGNSENFLFMKYDSLGTLHWHKTWDAGRHLSERFGGMAVDPRGNIYLGGQTDPGRPPAYGIFDLAWCKCSTSGKIEWDRTYNGPGNNSDIIMGICVDSLGNALITGQIYCGSRDQEGTEYDFFILKHSPDNQILWKGRYDAFRANDRVVAVSTDRQDNVIVAGLSENEKQKGAIVVIKYAP